ncbi:hypothetical protein F2Q68_00045682 [Brassica cretica]|uniref:Uncharacterized protein n=1 Tax=Brassica cretica TaxID=69181 RepID=A0A8S9LTC0_BRACR|nr:hypothetical protein F2Q68_00045682 [Brassica cretica]
MGAEKKWLFTLFSVVFFSVFLLLLLYSISAFTSSPFPSPLRHGPHYPPSFAYYITGGRGDKDRIFRLLLAVYHPRNRYLLHLGGADATEAERVALLSEVKSVPAVSAFGNVDVLGKVDRLSENGASKTANTLHAVSILLKLDGSWSWFIELSALDYPLITQDDLSHVFASVNRSLNFIDHTSDLAWKESQRIKPIVVDPALYLARRTQLFTATEKRPTPDAFKVFTEILKRGRYRVTPGAWCASRGSWWNDPCSEWDDVNVVKAGPQAKKLDETIMNFLDDLNSQTNQCK